MWPIVLQYMYQLVVVSQNISKLQFVIIFAEITTDSV